MRRGSIVSIVVTLIFAVGLLSSSAAVAQDVTVPDSSVTVIGYGEASAPAESAIIQLSISEGNYGGPPIAEPGATPGARDREAVSGVVSALVDAGINETDIQVYVGSYIQNIGVSFGPPRAIVQFPLDAPDNARIAELVDAAAVAAADESLLIGQVGAQFEVEDCASLFSQAREAAIADARERADVQAELLGVTIGDVTGSVDLPSSGEQQYIYYGPFGGGSYCLPGASGGEDPSLYAIPPYDPSQEPEVSAYAQVQLSFAIEEVGEATPA